MENAITVQISSLNAGGYAILLLLRADAIIELYGEEPLPGVTLLADDARWLIQRLQLLVIDLESLPKPLG